MAITVSERQPCRAGSAWKLGQLRMVKPGTKPASSAAVRAAQQVADEEAVPGELGDDADVQPVGGVGAGVEVLHEELAAADVGAHVGEQPAKCSGAIGALFSHQTCGSTEGSRTTNLSLGLRPVWRPVETRKRAAEAEVALAAGDGRLHERGLEQVVVRPRHARESRSPRASSAD